MIRRLGGPGLALLLCSVISGRGVTAQELAGYHLLEPILLPDSLSETYLDGRFELRIARHAGSEMERELLGRAERLFPKPHQITEAAEQWLAQMPGSHGAWPDSFHEAAAAPGDRWWWTEWDGFWLPFSLTGATVVHYLERIRWLASVRNPFGGPGDEGPDHTASFVYEASTRVSDAGGTIVEMQMDFVFWCGRLCAIHLRHSRTVTFGADGEVLSVDGDGPPLYMVS